MYSVMRVYLLRVDGKLRVLIRLDLELSCLLESLLLDVCEVGWECKIY